MERQQRRLLSPDIASKNMLNGIEKFASSAKAESQPDKTQPQSSALAPVSIRELQTRLRDTQTELEHQKELVNELEARVWNQKYTSGSMLADNRLSFGFRGSSAYIDKLDLPNDVDDNFGLPLLEVAIDGLAHRIMLKRTTMSPIERQSLTFRGRSMFHHQAKPKTINILGNDPIKTVDKLKAFDEHFGTLSEIRESKVTHEGRSMISKDNAGVSKTPNIERESHSKLIQLKAENEKLKYETNSLKTALKRAHTEKTDIALSVSKVLEVSQLPEQFRSQIASRIEKSMIVHPVEQLVQGQGQTTSQQDQNKLNDLMEENEELIRKYGQALNRMEDLESAFEELMRNFVKMAKRESDVQMANLSLRSELHRLSRLIVYYSRWI